MSATVSVSSPVLDELRNAPVGIFDSGVGGLTVVREVMRQLPKERIVYFGDTARVPYGTKSQSTIIRFSRQDIAFLKSRGVKAIVVACNTASALALPTVGRECGLPIIGVVERGAILAAQRLNPRHIVGADLSEGMMAQGREKVRKAGLEDVISFQREDCMHLSFADQTFDAVTVAYGVRNFEDLDTGLREMRRVLKPDGHLLILELAAPPHFPMRQLFWLYSHVVMPLAGRLFSRDKRAYTYLTASMEAFPQGEVMEGLLRQAGFGEVEWRRFTFGICTMYLACVRG